MDVWCGTDSAMRSCRGSAATAHCPSFEMSYCSNSKSVRLRCLKFFTGRKWHSSSAKLSGSLTCGDRYSSTWPSGAVTNIEYTRSPSELPE